MTPFEALYDRKCRTPLCWSKLDKRQIVHPDLIRKTEEKVKLICDRLMAASDRKKSYVDLKCYDIEFQVGDRMFLKVSTWKKVLRFSRKVSMLRKYRSDQSHVVLIKKMKVLPDLTYEEESIKILARKMKVL
ncbi:uncharacterized protein LOC128039938 [Gossypium raimondii]|uniref:uncharacterized protein LOC128039938 n=1 Tax=Gossypium raimondii TaxID=29730 RepID=UPI00227C928D|nr:uncharacterized protein LOC128039938 [Gossypium raimondii]